MIRCPVRAQRAPTWRISIGSTDRARRSCWRWPRRTRRSARTLAPGYPDIAAQVAFSVRHEWCERLEDFMLRRSYLGFTPDRGLGAAVAVSYRMQHELQWSEGRRRDEVRAYRARVERDLLPAVDDHERTRTRTGRRTETASMVAMRRRV